MRPRELVALFGAASLLPRAAVGQPSESARGQIRVDINGKTAKALGLAVPPSLLARADEVIE